MWPFKKRPTYIKVWKVEFVSACVIADGRATFDFGNIREEFVTTGPYGTMSDAAAEFIKTVWILPHGYIHRISEVKRISK